MHLAVVGFKRLLIVVRKFLATNLQNTMHDCNPKIKFYYIDSFAAGQCNRPKDYNFTAMSNPLAKCGDYTNI